MQKRLEGKTALVTGATSNIGRAIAIAFGDEGAHVVVSGRSAERGAEVVNQIIAGGGSADFVAADLDGFAVASTKLAVELPIRAIRHVSEPSTFVLGDRVGLHVRAGDRYLEGQMETLTQ